MNVVGGTYFESCAFPAWAGRFGSGARAAMAVSALSPGTRLSTYAYAESAGDLRATMAAFEVETDIVAIGERLEFGMVGLNTGSVSMEVAPFGGIKQSGIGREGGATGIEEYLETKSFHMGGLKLA